MRQMAWGKGNWGKGKNKVRPIVGSVAGPVAAGSKPPKSGFGLRRRIMKLINRGTPLFANMLINPQFDPDERAAKVCSEIES